MLSLYESALYHLKVALRYSHAHNMKQCARENGSVRDSGSVPRHRIMHLKQVWRPYEMQANALLAASVLTLRRVSDQLNQ